MTGLKKVVFALITGTLMFPLASVAEEGALPFDFNNRLRVEFDDNVRQEKYEEDDSLRLVEEFNISKTLNFDATRLALGYGPSFSYYDDRDEDDTDLHHFFDGRLEHEFSEILRLSIKETFRLAEQPEYMEGGVITRENNDYAYNSLNANMDANISDETVLGAGVRWVNLGYDEDSVADAYDYDQLVFGGDVTHALDDTTDAGVEARFSSWDYEDDGRDADSVQVGVVGRKDFNDQLAGQLRAGMEFKDLDNANDDSTESPYVDGSFIFQAAEGTALNFGASYSLAESSIPAYANQTRLSVYAGLDQNLTDRVSLNLGASYALGDYDTDDLSNSVETGSVNDGEENYLVLSSRLSYMLDDANSIEANFQHLDLDSDVAPDTEYDQNRVSLGWRLSL